MKNKLPGFFNGKNMIQGWIKLHRKFIEWEWYTVPEMVQLFIHLLITANHEDGSWRGKTIKRGQLITGRFSLSEATGISEQSIRTCLTRLKSTNEITIKSTSKYSIITIIKYDDYQLDDRISTSKSTSKLTNNQPATNQQLTTNNNGNNKENDKKVNIISSEQSSQVNELFKIFYEINPTINFANSTMRKSGERLISKLGLEKALGSARAAVAVYGQKYAPTITTPAQLETKLSELVAYYKKQDKQEVVDLDDPRYL